MIIKRRYFLEVLRLWLPATWPKSRRTIAAVLFGVMGLAEPAFAQLPTQLVFGPKVYARAARQPLTVTDTFTAPSGVHAPFVLHIENGAPAVPNAKPVTAAVIRINGVRVLCNADFSGAGTSRGCESRRDHDRDEDDDEDDDDDRRRKSAPVKIIDKAITLKPGANTITVRISGGAGSGFRLRILGAGGQTIPSALTPSSLGLLVGEIGTLVVTLAPPPTAAGKLVVTSNNTAVATVPAAVAFSAGQSSVSIPVTAVAPGNAQISVSLNGSSLSANVTVTPAITFTGQAPKDVTLPGNAKPEIGAAYATTTGAIDPAQVTFTLNGQNVTSQALIGPRGAVFVPASALPNGVNTVTLSVKDTSGHIATSTWSFTLNDPAPRFYDETPRDVYLVNPQPSIQVYLSGFNINPNTVRVTLNGVDVTAQANIGATLIRLQTATALSEGLHTIAVSATDGRGVAGNKTWSFTVRGLPLPADTTDGDRPPITINPELRLP